ncbi:MAG: hypothetical protein ABSG36_02190 [Acidimicrobiales bacterium]
MVVDPPEGLLELGLFEHGVVDVDVFVVAVAATAFAGVWEALVEALAIAAPPRPNPNDPPTTAAMANGFFNFMRILPSLLVARIRGIRPRQWLVVEFHLTVRLCGSSCPSLRAD